MRATTASATTELAPGDQVGGWTLGERLGEGAAGTVYRASRDGVDAALKVLRGELVASDEQRRRFARERRTAAAVRCSHLVTLLDDGDTWLAMDHLPGGTLAQRIAASGPLALEDALRVVAGVAAGLDALHGAGICHRDVKSANVLFDADGAAVLGDLGLVKGAGDSTLTRAGGMVGSISYLAPEVIRNGAAQPASDIYALGCLAYECLAGAPPFAGRGMFAEAGAQLDEAPGDPCAGRDDVPEGFGRHVVLALEKDPAARPASAMLYARLLRVAAGV